MNSKYQAEYTPQTFRTVMFTGILATTFTSLNLTSEPQQSILSLSASNNYINATYGTQPTNDSHKNFLTGRYSLPKNSEAEFEVNKAEAVLKAFYASLEEFDSLYAELAK